MIGIMETQLMIVNETTDRSSTAEQAFLARICLRAQRHVLWMRALWGSSLSEGEQGLAISHSEVDRILADRAELGETEATFYATDPAAQRLSKQIQQADLLALNDERWSSLRREFALSDEEIDLLALAVAVELDPWLRRAYGYIHDDATACYPTPWLASRLFEWHAMARIGPESALVRWKMAWPVEGASHPWASTTPWVADPAIVRWLTQGQIDDPALGTAVAPISLAESQEQLCLYPAELSGMLTFVEAMRKRRLALLGEEAAPEPVEIELIAPEGAGKRTLTAQTCSALGLSLIAANASLLLGADIPPPLAVEQAMRVARAARLSGALLYWHQLTGVPPQVWRAIQGAVDLMIFGMETPSVRQQRTGVARKSFQLASLTRAARMDLWRRLSDQPVPYPVEEWLLTPAEITDAALVADAGIEAVVEACQHTARQQPDELFSPLACPYTWDDLILSANVRQHLVELEAQARLRWQVYEEWGFKKLSPIGQGLTALFAGPSGTGKTMAAQVLARSLGMELYRVDLAGVINKYIGETEKRLKQVFEACERANVLLFFDEADALFGQRMQVKDAHDRFANIEIDYLLQRMEQFDGVAILATNRKGDLDKAFLRRIRFIVDFVHPTPTERLALWRLALLPRTPAGEELLDQIDWQFLADKLNMTGADIKASALGAAFLARAAGTRITMQHILHAARREMTKHGVVLRPGDWES